MIFEPNPLAFWILAAMVVGCGVAVVRARMLYHAGLALVGTLMGVAGLFVLLQVYFLAGLQVLVYVGAIAVLLLFSIMLTHHMMAPERGTVTTQPWMAAAVCLLVLAVLLGAVFNSTWVTDPNRTVNPTWAASSGFQSAEAVTSVKALAVRFLTPYTLPFELVSVLILVAMIGALVVARKDERPPQEPDRREETAL